MTGAISIPKPGPGEVNDAHHTWSRPETIVGKSLCDLSDQALRESAKMSSAVSGSTPPILSFIRCAQRAGAAATGSGNGHDRR